MSSFVLDDGGQTNVTEFAVEQNQNPESNKELEQMGDGYQDDGQQPSDFRDNLLTDMDGNADEQARDTDSDFRKQRVHFDKNGSNTV